MSKTNQSKKYADPTTENKKIEPLKQLEALSDAIRA